MTSKLARRCLVLAAMILGLACVALSDRYAQPVTAAPCCENCRGGGDAALGGLGCLGVSLSLECQAHCALAGSDPAQLAACNACQSACYQDVQQCYSHCVFCYSNSGPGGDCNSTGDCPVNYFCGADNTCQPY